MRWSGIKEWCINHPTHYKDVTMRSCLVKNNSNRERWSAHVAKVAAEGEKTLSWVLSVFRDHSKLTMLTLYNSLVRSKLEYCCTL